MRRPQIMVICVAGLGNRLNNLANLSAIQDYFGDTADYFIEWVPTNHCHVLLGDILQVNCMFDHPVTVYNTHQASQYTKYHQAIWANTAAYPNKWDALEHWQLLLFGPSPTVRTVVSTTHRYFRFCTLSTVRHFFQERMKWKPRIEQMTIDHMNQHNINSSTTSIHIRMGDLFNHYGSLSTGLFEQIMADSKSIIGSQNVILCTDSNDVRNLMKQHSVERDITYSIITDETKIQRSSKAVMDSCIDLIVLSRTNVIAYMPYSTYSVIAILSNIRYNKAIIDIHTFILDPYLQQTNSLLCIKKTDDEGTE